jgi:hypothetical protein
MANEHDRPGRLAVTILPPIGKSGSNQAVAPYSGAGLPARPTPSVPLPHMDSRMSRRQLVRLTENLSATAAATDAATRLYTSLGALEFARQEAERVHAARRHLPILVETERTTLFAGLLRAQADLDTVRGALEQGRIEHEQQHQLAPAQTERLCLALEHDLAQAQADADARRAELADQRARRDRQRQIEEQEFEIKQLELAARRRAAETQLRHTASLAELRGDAERHKAQAEAYRTRAEAEKLRRSSMPSETGAVPETLREHLAAELEINRNRTPALQLAAEIRDRAAGEKRPLTPEEAEIVDLLESAAAAAEDSIRRGAASDLEE